MTDDPVVADQPGNLVPGTLSAIAQATGDATPSRVAATAYRPEKRAS